MTMESFNATSGSAKTVLPGDNGRKTATASLGFTFFLILAPTLVLLQRHLSRYQRIRPKDVPWVGIREGEWFARARGQIREWWQGKQNILEGYTKYSKLGKPFLSPQVTWKPEVIIPPEHVRWLVDQPDSAFSIHAVLIDDLRFDYTAPRAWDFHRAFHVEALNKMNLDAMTPALLDELAFRTAQEFGATPGGAARTAALQASLFAILLAVTNRAFAGKALARDDAGYAAIVSQFVLQLPHRAALIDAVCPTLLKPLLAPCLARPLRRLAAQYEQHLLPTIDAHLSAAAASARDDDGSTEERSANLIQLMARCAARSPSAHDRTSARSLASRLLALNFVGVHTSVLTAIAAFVDMLAAGPALWSDLRAEAAAALRAAPGGQWSKAAVGQLVLLDSAIRESMRVTPFKGRGLEREVVKRGGVTLPDGTHLPRGTKVGAPTVGIHGDERFYGADARMFKPARFLGRAEKGLVNAEETFLGFGFGRHACPGRFFSAHELKLLFAHFVLNYDFEVVGEPPEGTWMTDFHVFATPFMVKARMREKSAHLE